jgi:ATP-dependent Lon protease
MPPTTIRPGQIYDVGTLANVLQLLKLPDGTVKVLVEGGARAEIGATPTATDYFEAARPLPSRGETVEVEALARSVVRRV